MGGIVKNLFGSKDKAATSNNPAYIDQGGQEVYNRGKVIADKPYQAYTGQRVAPLTDNQNLAATKAADQIGRFGDQFSNVSNLFNQSAQPYGQTYSPTNVNVGDVGTSANPQSISTNRFDNYDIGGYIDPYVQSVLQPQLDDIKEEGALDQNALNARAGNTGNFGGSRQALLNDLLQRRTDKRADTATNTAYSQAFNNAENMFTSDESRGLQAQGKQADIYGEDIGNMLKAALSNQSKDVDLGKFNETQDSDAFKTNYNIFSDNATRQENAGKSLLDVIGKKSDISSNNINDLLKTGGLGQLNNQQQDDVNYGNFTDQRDYDKQMTEFLSNLLKTNVGTGSVTAPAQNGNNGVGNAIGTAAQIASLLAGSDARIKTHAIKVGEKDGINIYEFNYTDEPQRYRGVMAQEVEHIPGAVIEEGGILKVNYSKLPIEFERIGA